MSSTNHQKDTSTLYSYFNEFRLQEKFCDVVVKVGERSFPCHRIILASALKYFRRMFAGGFKEAEKNEIELKGIDANDFELLLCHIYGGPVSFTANNTYRLLRISNYVGLSSLEEMCVDNLATVDPDTIPLNTAISILLFALEAKKTILEEKILKYLAENFVLATKEKTFVYLPGTLVLKILEQPNRSRDAIATLDYLSAWIKLQSDEGRQLLPELLNAANLEKIPNEWLVKMLTSINNPKNENDSIALEKKLPRESKDNDEYECLENVFLDEHLCKDEKIASAQDFPFVICISDNESRPPFIYHLSSSKRNDHVRLLDAEQERRNTAEAFSDRFINFKSCKLIRVRELQYLIMQDFGMSEDTHEYRYMPFICRDFKANQQFSEFRTEKSGSSEDKEFYPLTVTEIGNKIYLYDYEIEGSGMRVFDCELDNWSDMKISISDDDFNPPQPVYPNLLSYKESLYLIGGKYRESENYFLHRDVREENWSLLPSMKYVHSRAASCIHNGILYVSGGENLTYHKGYIECFDFKAGKWYDFETSMLKPKRNHTFFAYDNKFWFFGGEKYDRSGVLQIDQTWYSYDLNEHAWSDISALPTTLPNHSNARILDVVVEI